MPDEQAMQVLASWHYAALFSLFVTVPLWLLAGFWVWFRDNGDPASLVGDMLQTWAFVYVVLTVAIKWDNRQR